MDTGRSFCVRMLLFSPFPPALAEMIRETFSWKMFVIIQETRALKYIFGMKDMTKTRIANAVQV